MVENNALWHQVSEEEKVKILENAKAIMDSFHEALKKVEKEAGESEVERDSFERSEEQLFGKSGEKPEEDKEFRKIMFKNAPHTDGDCIEAERGKWT